MVVVFLSFRDEQKHLTAVPVRSWLKVNLSRRLDATSRGRYYIIIVGMIARGHSHAIGKQPQPCRGITSV